MFSWFQQKWWQRSLQSCPFFYTTSELKEWPPKSNAHFLARSFPPVYDWCIQPSPIVLIFPIKVVFFCKSFTIYRFLKLAYPSLSSLLMFNCLPREFWKLQWELSVTLMPRSKLRLFCNWSKTFRLWRLLYCLETGFNLENSKPSSSIFGDFLKSKIGESTVCCWSAGLVVNMVDWTL